MTANKDIECSDDRFAIAKNLVFISSGIILLFSLVIIFKSGNTLDDAKELFTIILPVISTWVGAVIAYYFSKDNFETAAKTNESLIKQLSPQEKLQSTKAEDIMTIISKISYIALDENKNENSISLKNDILLKKLNDKINRVPFIKDSKIVYILHKSIIDDFLVKYTKDEILMENLTLKNLLDEEYYETYAKKSFETAKPTDNLTLIKRLMDENKLCSDVFITIDGTKNSEVLGWITNSKLMNYAKV
ncbi:hypothetical protein [Halarcobacter sp.]|uniref:hypothetical protein n=1 Tax=Halarcobacter sp. TaxID=2321133 RepID=UPI002AAC2FC2|nr:hypothetical protein [Halarcobacter sp.]